MSVNLATAARLLHLELCGVLEAWPTCERIEEHWRIAGRLLEQLEPRIRNQAIAQDRADLIYQGRLST